MPITPTPHIWMNGEMVPWEDAKIHVLTHTLHYGTGVFEGIRAYETEQGPAIFRLTEHIERLYNSAKILGMPMPYDVPTIVQACKDVVADSGLDACYLRPIAYYGYGEMGLATGACTTDIAIAAWPWGAYLGDDAVTKGDGVGDVSVGHSVYERCERWRVAYERWRVERHSFLKDPPLWGLLRGRFHYYRHCFHHHSHCP